MSVFLISIYRIIQFVRCLSEQQPVTNEEQIKASVELGSNRNLVGDRSRTYLLPRCTSRKHADLACISAETVRISIEERIFFFVNRSII